MFPHQEVVVWGPDILKAWSRTQTPIALSSSESESAAVTKAAAEALGIQSVLADFGDPVKLEIHSDASAAIVICKRQGLGQYSHLLKQRNYYLFHPFLKSLLLRQ